MKATSSIPLKWGCCINLLGTLRGGERIALISDDLTLLLVNGKWSRHFEEGRKRKWANCTNDQQRIQGITVGKLRSLWKATALRERNWSRKRGPLEFSFSRIRSKQRAITTMNQPRAWILTSRRDPSLLKSKRTESDSVGEIGFRYVYCFL